MNGCQLTLAEAATAMHGELTGADVVANIVINGVSTDSRKIQPGQLFIALKGPNFDGHEFAAAALAGGAAALVVEHRLNLAIPQICVKNSLLALGQLAAAWRARLNIPIIAITGSNGKTTVKEMVATILGRLGNVFATKGNLNNDIGMPLSLLSVDQSHSAAVIEMGANHANEISYLTNLARPTIALVNNAGAAHLEGFGSIEGVARAKGEIYQGLVLGGFAIINADDPFASLWRELAGGAQIMTFGMDQSANVSGAWSHSGPVVVTTIKGDFTFKPALAGRHNVLNALAATAITVAANVALDDIRAGLEAMQPVPGRLQPKLGYHGALLINDTYNANPFSTKAAIAVLKEYPGPKILVLGDMGELGGDARALHAQIGEAAKQAGIDELLALGELSKAAVAAFGSGALHFSGFADLITAVRKRLARGTTVLVKGSRSMKMETVVNACIEQDD